MILQRERGAEQRHDAVAHHLIHRSLVAVHRLDHFLQHRIEHRAGFLGVAIGKQLHRSFEIGEQDGDLFSLAFDSVLGELDSLGQMLRSVLLRGGKARR